MLDLSHERMQKMTTAVEQRGGKLGLHMNIDKCKIMISNNWVDETEIQIGNAAIEMTEEFCYLGSYVTSDSSCDKDWQTRTGKASSVFERLKSVWKNRHQHQTQSEIVWVVSDVHNVIRCRIVATNSCTKEEARSRTSQVPWHGYLMESTKSVITRGSGRRHNWLGHVLRMDDNRLPRQLYTGWDISSSKRKPGRPQKNWRDTIRSTARCQQRWLASTCDPMCLWHGMN